MSEFKGTKGKWEADEDHVASLDETVNGNLICVIPEQMYYRSREKWGANALLISKAPEMLDLLKVVVEQQHLLGCITSETHKKINQLIKEATEI